MGSYALVSVQTAQFYISEEKICRLETQSKTVFFTSTQIKLKEKDDEQDKYKVKDKK